MEERRKYIEKVIAENSKNEMEAAAIRTYAISEEVGFPTPQNDLPNLKKDRIVLELVNRTPNDSEINILALPSGSNNAQGINYGDLFITKYSQVLIPISDVNAGASTYTINWNDEDGNPQTYTTNSVAAIEALLFDLNNNPSIQDSFDFTTIGTDYLLYKMPIDTWVYWTPPLSLPAYWTPSGGQASAPFYGGTPNNLQASQNNYWGLYLPTYQGGSTSRTYWVYSESPTSSLMAIGSGVDSFSFDYVNLSTSYGIAQAFLISYDDKNDRLFISDSSVSGDIFSIDNNSSNTLLATIPNPTTDSSFIFSAQFDILTSNWFCKSSTNRLIKIDDSFSVTFNSAAEPSWTGIDFVGTIAKPFVFLPNGDMYVIESDNALSRFYLHKMNRVTMAVTASYDIETLGGFTFAPTAIINTALYNPLTGNILLSIQNASTTFIFATFNPDTTVVTDKGEYTNALAGTVVIDQDNNVIYCLGGIPTSSNAIVTFNATTEDFLYSIDGANITGITPLNGAVFNPESQTFFTAKNEENIAVQWLYNPISNPSIPSGAQPADFYTENEFTTLDNNSLPQTYTFSSYDVIEGTGISVTETTGNMPYEELVQGIRNNLEPYFFNEMTVYANNIDQANVPVKKVIRDMAGTTKTMIDNATIFHQNQFVTTEQISIAPRTLNEIDYKIKAFETVTIIINYTKGNLNAIAETIDAYILEGVPFNVAITQLSEAVNEKEKEYLESTLKSIWNRKKKEFSREGIDIDIDRIFAPQEYINSNKKEFLGNKMRAVKTHIEKKRAEAMNLKGISPKNIKNIVANYVAKGDANEIFDPYSYADGEDNV